MPHTKRQGSGLTILLISLLAGCHCLCRASIIIVAAYEWYRGTCRHNKNLNTDAWRKIQLWRHVANPQHPINRFATGNLQTLLHTPKVVALFVLHKSLKQLAQANCSTSAALTSAKGSVLGQDMLG